MRIYILKNETKNKSSWINDLKMILVRDYGLKQNDLEFSENQYGKPYLINNKVYFNVSHSGKLVVIAISKEEVGVDIEIIQSRKYRDEIVLRTFNEKEKEIYEEHKNIDYFYEVWTKKEAYVKLIGTGITDMFKTLPIYYDKVIVSRKIKVLDDDYYLSLATKNNNERNNIELKYE